MVKARMRHVAPTLPEVVIEEFARIPAVLCVALVDGDEGTDLWIVVDADPVAAGGAVIPIVGELLARHAGLIADFRILPNRGRLARDVLPPGARAILVREAA